MKFTTFELFKLRKSSPLRVQRGRLNNACEVRFTNNMNVETGDCSILLNNKYKHGIKGLQCKKNNKNTLLINESASINPGESITIAFNNESGNREMFEIKANLFFKPETVELIIGNDTLIWQFNLSLRESFF